jgi:hypothetical protein
MDVVVFDQFDVGGFISLLYFRASKYSNIAYARNSLSSALLGWMGRGLLILIDIPLMYRHLVHEGLRV